jgi:MoaA/NifB/PqqE/SkfB family radical SAM enzyme
MKAISYNRFQAHLKRQNVLQRMPLECQWEITSRCNLSCVYCYRPKGKKIREMTFREAKGIIDDLCRQGCLWLTFTGGEPFLRKDFPDIYQYAHRKGLLITLFTNGTLLDESKADLLEEYRPLMIEFTLNSLTEATYEKIAQHKGSFKKAMRAIELILDCSLPLGIKTMGLTLNKDEIPRIEEHVRNVWKLPFLFDAVIMPSLDGDKAPCRYRLSPQGARDNEPQKANEPRPCQAYYPPLKPWEDAYGCNTGQYSFYITSSGYIKPCPFQEDFQMDLRKTTLEHAFFDVFPRWLKVKCDLYSIPKLCRDCSLRLACRICWSRAGLEIRKGNGRLEFYCRLANKS